MTRLPLLAVLAAPLWALQACDDEEPADDPAADTAGGGDTDTAMDTDAATDTDTAEDTDTGGDGTYSCRDCHEDQATLIENLEPADTAEETPESTGEG